MAVSVLLLGLCFVSNLQILWEEINLNASDNFSEMFLHKILFHLGVWGLTLEAVLIIISGVLAYDKYKEYRNIIMEMSH